MDWTPLIHALIALLAQALVGLVVGNWWLAREHTQAEYRWIQAFAGGHRAGMPWWGGFAPRVWNWASGLDALAPAAACFVLFVSVRA